MSAEDNIESHKQEVLAATELIGSSPVEVVAERWEGQHLATAAVVDDLRELQGRMSVLITVMVEQIGSMSTQTTTNVTEGVDRIHGALHGATSDAAVDLRSKTGGLKTLNEGANEIFSEVLKQYMAMEHHLGQLATSAEAVRDTVGRGTEIVGAQTGMISLVEEASENYRNSV